MSFLHYIAYFCLLSCTIMVHAQTCNTPPSSKVCKLSGMSHIHTMTPKCDAPNNAVNDPLGISSTNSPGQSECIQMIYEDGARCVYSHARLMCSTYCMSCTLGSIVDNKKICGSRCTETATRCPTAHKAGCFDAVFQICVGDDQPCSNVGINKDIIDVSKANPYPLEPLLPPTKLRTPWRGRRKATLRWRKPDLLDFDNYRISIQKKKNDGSWPSKWSFVANLPVNTGKYGIKGLKPGKTYRWRIRSIDTFDKSGWSKKCRFTTKN